MREDWWRAPLRTALLAIGVAAVSWLLTTPGSYQTLPLVGIFAAGALLFLEAAILRRRNSYTQRELEGLRQKETETSPKQKELGYQLLVARRQEEWFWRAGILLLLVSSFGFTVRFSDQIDKVLTNHTQAKAQQSDKGPVTIDTTLKLDPNLETALLDTLRRLVAPNGGGTRGVPIFIILVAVAVIALIGLAIKYEPEATPLTAAIATLTATATIIEKLVGEGRMLPLGGAPWQAILVSLTLVALGICLIVIGSLYLLNSYGDATWIKQRALFGGAVLVFGFSAALLAMVPPLLFHSEPKAGSPKSGSQPCPQCPSTPVMDKRNVSAIPLDPLDSPREGDETVEPKSIQQLTNDLGKKGAPGDVLLLLGSADCIPTRPCGRWKSNEDLAKARANWVFDRLKDQPVVHGITIERHFLRQHVHCGTTPNVRAVYPFLVGVKKSLSSNAPP